MNKYVCHPNGNDLNGGGYKSTAGSPEPPAWSAWHNAFDAVAIANTCTVSDSSGTVKIDSVGSFASSMIGCLVYCDFDGVYDDGRYLIYDAGDDFIKINVVYISVASVNVRVGGAIKSPAAACTLAYGTDGNELLFPANQTTQTENLVNGSANQVLVLNTGGTIDMYSVDESTGVRLTTTDSTKWAVIKAQDSSSWSSNTALMQINGGSSSVYPTFKCDKILFDGNYLTPIVLVLSDGASGYIYMNCGDIEVKNSIESTGSGVLQNGFVIASLYDNGLNIKTLKISSCAKALFVGRPSFTVRNYVHIDDCEIGINLLTAPLHYVDPLNNVIISNCAKGLYHVSKSSYVCNARFTFVNNDIDLDIVWNYGSGNYIMFSRCVFEHSAGGGYVVNIASNSGAAILTLQDCVYSDEATLTDSDVPTLINCQTIHGYPFVDTGDYRLNPAFADLDKIYDWDKVTNVIGATTRSEPACGGGSGGCFVQAGSGRFGVQES